MFGYQSQFVLQTYPARHPGHPVAVEAIARWFGSVGRVFHPEAHSLSAICNCFVSGGE